MSYEDIIVHWATKYKYNHTGSARSYETCVEKMPYGNFKCFSPYCPEHCTRWTMKHRANIMRGTGMNCYRLILPVGDVVPPKMLAQIWENFNKKLRRMYPDCEWYWVLELQGSNLHYHVLLQSNDTVTYKAIDSKWRKTLAKKKITLPANVVMVKEVYDLEGIAAYNVKNGRRDTWKFRPPPGLYRNLAMGTRKFTIPSRPADSGCLVAAPQ